MKVRAGQFAEVGERLSWAFRNESLQEPECILKLLKLHFIKISVRI
jgi:hypothetical protein